MATKADDEENYKQKLVGQKQLTEQKQPEEQVVDITQEIIRQWTIISQEKKTQDALDNASAAKKQLAEKDEEIKRLKQQLQVFLDKSESTAKDNGKDKDISAAECIESQISVITEVVSDAADLEDLSAAITAITKLNSQSTELATKQIEDHLATMIRIINNYLTISLRTSIKESILYLTKLEKISDKGTPTAGELVKFYSGLKTSSGKTLKSKIEDQRDTYFYLYIYKI